MSNDLRLPLRTIPVGKRAFEVLAPERMSGARVTLTRHDWPGGPLFRWAVWERERNGLLVPLLTPAEPEMGGRAGYIRQKRDGEAPLVIGLRWADDDDRDLIRFEIEVYQAFRTSVSIEWIP